MTAIVVLAVLSSKGRQAVDAWVGMVAFLTAVFAAVVVALGLVIVISALWLLISLHIPLVLSQSLHRE